MFRALSAHLQEDIIVHMQHNLLSLYESSWWPVGAHVCTDRPPRTLHLHRQVGACTRTYLPMKMEQSVPKRRHTKFRRRGITQKKAYNIDVITSQIYFVMNLYMFRTVPVSIIRSLFTVHSTMVYVIQVCRQLVMDRGTVRNM